MKKVLLMAALVALVASPAMAGLVPVSPSVDDLTGAAVFGSPRGTLLYSRTIETGSRFNPGMGGIPPGSGVQADVTFDDVPIPATLLGGFTAVDVNKVTVGIRRIANAPATNVSLYWATCTTIYL